MTDYLTDAENEIKDYFETHDIPTHFYQCFFGELVKVFGIKPLVPDDDCSYREQLELYLNSICGTGGWNLAFEEACRQCDLMDVYEDYSKMDWVQSDILDGHIADNTVKMLFADLYSNDYYMFKIHKERKND